MSDSGCNENLFPRAFLSHIFANQPIATLYINIVVGQGSLFIGPSLKLILTNIGKLTDYTEIVLIVN